MLNAGIVDQYIDGTEAVFHIVDRGFGLSVIGHVENYRFRHEAFIAKFRAGGMSALVIAAIDKHFCSGPSQTASQFEADTATGTRQKSLPAIETKRIDASRHKSSLYCYWKFRIARSNFSATFQKSSNCHA
ncbi:hypothetical protein GCM10017624_29040 [Azotobacter vinelandii]|nr:hypothetical protein GCM10017624_29040 [Azotobacter vinelandii]